MNYEDRNDLQEAIIDLFRKEYDFGFDWVIDLIADALINPEYQPDPTPFVQELVPEICPDGDAAELAAELVKISRRFLPPPEKDTAVSQRDRELAGRTSAQPTDNNFGIPARGGAAGEVDIEELRRKEKKTEEEFLRYFGGAADDGGRRQVLQKYAHEFYDTCEVTPDGRVVSTLEEVGIQRKMVARPDGSPVLPGGGARRNRQVADLELKAAREKTKLAAAKEKQRIKDQKQAEAKKKEETIRRVAKKERRAGRG